MFGGYHGQECDLKRIDNAKIKLDNDPKNKDLIKEYNRLVKCYEEKMNSALRSYSRI